MPDVDPETGEITDEPVDVYRTPKEWLDEIFERLGRIEEQPVKVMVPPWRV